MKKWEYKTIEIDFEKELGEDLKEKTESFLNRAANLGWEFSQHIDGTFPFFILKREIIRKRGRPRKETK